ncbi:hypothetical protein AC482_03405 [miscellaneous Crenarchaeota group-15 archaeon DG-45]|uniref:Uncharacterized protein n=1 Tax=miscellaneous Crenarchaeota group-15 archaeon DG-45 TaxID=1685127 RepID=A0A0M0BPX7_9ARCH|nr:MAG: hypothetical protein AC482_03405 [miscellaneous Crenarchaeota group-15 archaeon DG-45]
MDRKTPAQFRYARDRLRLGPKRRGILSYPHFIDVVNIRNSLRIESVDKKLSRQLSRRDTLYLKEKHVRGLDRYHEIERFDYFFSEAQALQRGEYGDVFYVSMGPNPRKKVYKVTIERAGERQVRPNRAIS